MLLRHPISLPNSKKLSPLVRLKLWWQRLTPSRQDLFAMLTPLAAVILFLAAIVAAVGYLRLEEIDREHEALKRDVEYTQQRIRLRLMVRQEQLMRFAREVSNREFDVKQFQVRAESMITQHPELQDLTWIDEHRYIKASVGTASFPSNQPQEKGRSLSKGDTNNNFSLTQKLQQPTYAQGMAYKDAPAMLQLYLPLFNRDSFSGVLLAQYSNDGLFHYGVPSEVAARYAISFHDATGGMLAGASIPVRKRAANWLPWVSPVNVYDVPVSPVGDSLIVRGQAYRTSLGVVGSGLFWLVAVLSAMTAWMLIANWRHTRRRLQAQQALVSETAFRRAMENSILTGMRTLDLQGRITYVNAAFCQMTGWSETVLVGQIAPFPYWPEEDS